MAARKVVIDADPATGYPLKDVDDGLAMLYLLALESEFEILGVTPVYGNAPLKRTVPKACEVLEVAGRTDIPVMPGAACRRDLGRETDASRFLVDAVRDHPGEVTVLALGPLTNVATAGMDPGFFENVESVVIMGGALEEGFGIPLVSPLEFNFFKDPEAADMLIAAPCEKVVISADLCRQAVFTRRELDALIAMGNRASLYLAEAIEPWLRLNQVMPFLPWRGGFVPWDVVAAVYLRRPELFGEIERRGMRLRPGRVRTGRLEPDRSREGSPTTVPRSMEALQMLDEFLAAIDSY